MTYSHWQIARLRKRLTSYKLHRKRTWEQIATAILYCDAMPEAYVEQEDVRPLSESLRRFTSMIQEPHEERLTAIRLYLQAEGYLTTDDLVEASFPYHLAMSYMEAFGDTESQLPDKKKIIDGTWICTIAETPSLMECVLEVSTEDHEMILVEETQTYYCGIGPDELLNMPPARRARHRRSVQRCRGFSAPSTQNKFCFFLIGHDYPDINHVIFAVVFEIKDEVSRVIERIYCCDYSSAEMMPGSDLMERELLSSRGDDYKVKYNSDPMPAAVIDVPPAAMVTEILDKGRRVFQRPARQGATWRNWVV